MSNCSETTLLKLKLLLFLINKYFFMKITCTFITLCFLISELYFPLKDRNLSEKREWNN